MGEYQGITKLLESAALLIGSSKPDRLDTKVEVLGLINSALDDLSATLGRVENFDKNLVFSDLSKLTDKILLEVNKVDKAYASIMTRKQKGIESQVLEKISAIKKDLLPFQVEPAVLSLSLAKAGRVKEALSIFGDLTDSQTLSEHEIEEILLAVLYGSDSMTSIEEIAKNTKALFHKNQISETTEIGIYEKIIENLAFQFFLEEDLDGQTSVLSCIFSI